MNDDQILAAGGTQEDIEQYARDNGATYPPEKLTQDDLGRWVTYTAGHGGTNRGKIKTFDNELKLAWVVYHCNQEWDDDRWKNYTAAATKYEDLTL